MWLLSTDRAELHLFSGPDDPRIIGGYAILSHTWGDSKDEAEQTFQETQALRERCKATGANPRDLATQKVRESCILAARHGYRWIWNDTCCIDKTDSTEHSEAIKSMFRWYSLAEVCFAYLADVPGGCVLEAPGSAFRTARWHTRGWTLQELIAPSFVVFVSQDWKTVGNKAALASLLEEVTGVWAKVLTREVHYSKLCVARRMLWASKRSTKRVEDEAYCLMGLFDIHMPTIYGEGRHAFQRLQHELVKQSFDTSLFAWGRRITFENTAPVEPHENRQLFNTPAEHGMYIFAHSPKDFNTDTEPFGRVVRYTPSTTSPVQPYPPKETSDYDPEGRPLGPFGLIKLPRFSSTNYGMECHFPIIESDGLTVAVLICDTGREHLGLLLHPSTDHVQDPSRKKYHAGYGFREQARGVPYPDLKFARLVSLGDDFYNLRLNGKTVAAEWRDVLIAERPLPERKDISFRLCSALHSITPAPPFRIPHWLVIRLASIGMELRPLRAESAPVGGNPLHVSATFEDADLKEGICLILGTCTQSQNRPAHWAKATPRCSPNWFQKPDFSHDCREDHIDAWPGRMKDFGDAERTVRLSFSRCTLTPAHTLVVHVELEGHHYNILKDWRDVTFPSRGEIELGTNQPALELSNSGP